MLRRRAAGKHRLVRPKKAARPRCGDCTRRGLIGALVVPLAILAGALFDSVTKTPDAVANVIDSVSAGDLHTVTVTTTVTVPAGPEWTAPQLPAPAPRDAVTTPLPAPQPTVAAAQHPIGEAPDLQSCVKGHDTRPRTPKETPTAGMSVEVLPGRSGPNRGEHKESRAGQPVRCG